MDNLPCAFMIKQIHDALEKSANNSLRSQGLTLAQVNVLMILHNAAQNQASLKELEQQLLIAQSTTAGIVTRLEQKKLVDSFGDFNDKRIKIIRITALGEKLCANAEINMKQTEDQLLKGFNNKEQTQLKSFLQRIKKNIQ